MDDNTIRAVLVICVSAVAIAYLARDVLSGWLLQRERHKTIRERGYPPMYCDADGDAILDNDGNPVDYWDDTAPMAAPPSDARPAAGGTGA